MPSLTSLQPLSFLLIILSYLLAAVASPAPAPSPSPNPYELQSTGVICSHFFGNPVASDCHGILSSLSTEDLYRWFEFSLAPSTAADTVSLPWSDTIGSCALDIDIQPGARNNVSWATITHIAQTVLSSCSPLAADISIIISSTTSTAQSIKKAKLNPNTPADYDGQHTDTQSFFLDSFWEGEASEFKITVCNVDPNPQPQPPFQPFPLFAIRRRTKKLTHSTGTEQALPGYPDTQDWYYPLTTYAAQTTEEAASCTPPGHEETVTQCFDKGASCCEGAVCANRLIGDTGEVGLACVPLTPVAKKAPAKEE
ncbi:MAG: hypothetical protein LQ350_008584 [Teloschistes chrysophthalmus]|nr:MAG: hypothetical protein LQ350_008584 [Niorma chrysophthalma]